MFEIKVKLTGNSASTGTLCPLILPAGAPAGNPAEIPVDGQWHSVFLKHAQSINIDHIPFGVTYEVEEVPQSAATVSYENADGTISSVNGELVDDCWLHVKFGVNDIFAGFCVEF